MGDQEHRPVVRGVEDVPDEGLGGRRIEVGRGLVEEKHRRIGEERTGDDEPLALAAGEACPVFADRCVEPVGERRHPVGEPRLRERLPQRGVRRPRSGEPEVLADRRVEDVRLLPRQRKHASDVLLPQRAQIAAVEQHASFLRVEEPQQEVRDGRLPDAARADEGDPLTGLDPEVEVLERR